MADEVAGEHYVRSEGSLVGKAQEKSLGEAGCVGGGQARQKGIKLEAKDWNPQETLFAFLGWLTSREKSVTFGACHEASSAVWLIQEFSARHTLPDVRDGWEQGIVPE